MLAPPYHHSGAEQAMQKWEGKKNLGAQEIFAAAPNAISVEAPLQTPLGELTALPCWI